MKVKRSKKVILWLSLGLSFLVLSTTAILFVIFYGKFDCSFNDARFEINTSATVENLIDKIENGLLINGGNNLDTGTLGEHKQVVIIRNNFGKDAEIYADFVVEDTTPPEIFGEDSLVVYENDTIDIVAQYKSTDNSLSNVEVRVDGEYDTNKVGEYKLTVVAADQSGNTSKKDILLSVVPDPTRVAASKSSSSVPYYIKVNRKLNTVMIYGRDDSGYYTRLVKVFVASTGKAGSETPLGTFTVSDRYEALYLVGSVWGHYTLRINGAIFFHSVPYFTKGAPWNNLEYEEYNKLGEGASAGCVRLATADAKWIYDNISYGTTVEIYDADFLPSGVTKPSGIRIDPDSDKRGWDPTDPDPSNPWRL